MEGHAWASTGQELYRTTDSGQTWQTLDGITGTAGVGFGKGKEGTAYPAVFLIAKVNDVFGLYRSDDEGKSWVRINTATQQYGGANRIIGDPRKFGRAYIGTHGRGILVEWDITKNNWHSDRRHWYYRTGRRGILQVWDRESEYPDNIQHGYALPNYGDFYIRLIKKDGAPSRQFYKFSSGMAFSDQIIPNSWLPGDYKHEKAAPNEPDNWLVEFNGRRVAKR